MDKYKAIGKNKPHRISAQVKKNEETPVQIFRSSKNSPPPTPIVNEHEPMPREAFQKCGKEKSMDDESWPKNLTVKERYDIFMNETSFTALTRIHKANSIIKRIAWLVVVLGMLSWLSIQCYWLIDKYFQYPVEVKVELISVPKLEFPSVTICNRNPLKKSMIRDSPFNAIYEHLEVKDNDMLYNKAVEDAGGEDDDDDDSKEEKAPPAPEPTQTGNITDSLYINSTTKMTLTERMMLMNFNIWDMLKDENASREYYQTKDAECTRISVYSSYAAEQESNDLSSYGHQDKDLIMHCKFNSYPCSPENFTYVHNIKYGNCYTFNHFKNRPEPLLSDYAGPLMGLVMEFNIEQDEYVEALSPDAGVRVLVHPKGTHPFPEDQGITISPGFVTSIGLRQTNIGRLPPPHGTCANSSTKKDYYRSKFGVKYSKDTCLKSCYQDLIKAACNCNVPFYILPPRGKMCDLSNQTSSDCVMKVYETITECDKQCPSPCSETKYDPIVSMNMWPSKPFEKYLKDRLKKTNANFMDSDKLDDADENLAKLEVFYTELLYTTIDQQKAYESQNLISDIGGQLGLWLGLSAITIGEFVEFFAAIFKAVTARAVRRSHGHGDRSTPVMPMKT